jgi:hypothetical protein
MTTNYGFSSHRTLLGGGINPYPNKLPSYVNSQTSEFNIFPNHHQLDDHQVQEYLIAPSI